MSFPESLSDQSHGAAERTEPRCARGCCGTPRCSTAEDTDNSGKLTLDEIDEDTAKLWLTFKPLKLHWVRNWYGGKAPSWLEAIA